jgi:hypothetical protein
MHACIRSFIDRYIIYIHIHRCAIWYTTSILIPSSPGQKGGTADFCKRCRAHEVLESKSKSSPTSPGLRVPIHLPLALGNRGVTVEALSDFMSYPLAVQYHIMNHEPGPSNVPGDHQQVRKPKLGLALQIWTDWNWLQQGWGCSVCHLGLSDIRQMILGIRSHPKPPFGTRAS